VIDSNRIEKNYRSHLLSILYKFAENKYVRN